VKTPLMKKESAIRSQVSVGMVTRPPAFAST